MKKKKESSIPKNSKSTTPIAEEQNVKFTSESTAVLTISEQGSFKCRKSNAGTKEQKEKMKRSWVFDKDKKGKPCQSPDGEKWYPLKPGQKPKDYYEGPKEYNEPEYHNCMRHVVLNADSVQYFISEESCPGKSKKERAEWSALSKYERLVRHAIINAYPGELVSVKIVE